MKGIILTLLAILTVASLTQAALVPAATCQFTGTGGITGRVVIISEANGYNVAVKASGFPVTATDSQRGYSIREFVNAPSGDVFSSASALVYGCPGTAGIKDGCLGNLAVAADGTVNSNTAFTTQFTLQGANSLIGRLFTIQTTQDTCTAGSSGATVAQCILGVANPKYYDTTAAWYVTDYNISTNTAGTLAGSKALCQLTGVNTTVTGTVFIETSGTGVKITAKVSGLNKTIAHGIHIHSFGDISTDPAQTGPHWKVDQQVHNLPDVQTRELGDLGNICAYDSDGNAYYQQTTAYFGGFNNSVTDATSTFVGLAIVVHASRDNGTANSFGARISQCVIGIIDPNTTDPITIPTNVNFTSSPQCITNTYPPSDSSASISFPSFIMFIISSLVMMMF